MLEHEGSVARGRRQLRRVAPADVDRPGVGLFQPGDQPQRRRLAGTGRPEQHDELAVGDVQIEIFDRLVIAERLADALQENFSHAGLRHGSRCGSPGRRPFRRSTAAHC